MLIRSICLTAIAALGAAATLGIGLAPASAAPDTGSDRGLAHVHGQDDSRTGFDLQAHRGGLGLVVENTLPAFANAFEVGVTTLELDVQITEDGYAVVTHDRDPSPSKCGDTAPAFPDDPEFPYVPGQLFIKDLTLAQIRTIDCGSLRLSQYPDQALSPGARMPLLSEVFDLVHRYGARGVMLNIEAKVEAGAPEQTAPREQFVQLVAQEIRKADLLDQVSIQSFDWGALMRMRQVEPRLPIVALTNGQQFLQAGQAGASPWLGGIDIDDVPGDSLQAKFVNAAASFGADAVSPVHGDPQGGAVNDPNYVAFTTSELVLLAHAADMQVIPWTVNDRATVESLMDIGVDGLITDLPDRVREIMHERGLKLPSATEPPTANSPPCPPQRRDDDEAAGRGGGPVAKRAVRWPPRLHRRFVWIALACHLRWALSTTPGCSSASSPLTCSPGPGSSPSTATSPGSNPNAAFYDCEVDRAAVRGRSGIVAVLLPLPRIRSAR